MAVKFLGPARLGLASQPAAKQRCALPASNKAPGTAALQGQPLLALEKALGEQC